MMMNKGSKCICKHQAAQYSSPQQHNWNEKCGEYCKNLTPQEQKKIIIKCLIKEREKEQSLEHSMLRGKK